RAAEEALAKALTALMPGSVVVGEEEVAVDPGVLDRLRSDAPVWIIDPIDGTHNFAVGSPWFTTLVALAQGGELLGSWTFAPVPARRAPARRGQGSYVDGERVRVRPLSASQGLRRLDVSAPQPHWWPRGMRSRLGQLGRAGASLCFFDTVGLEYIELA